MLSVTTGRHILPSGVAWMQRNLWEGEDEQQRSEKPWWHNQQVEESLNRSVKCRKKQSHKPAGCTVLFCLSQLNGSSFTATKTKWDCEAGCADGYYPAVHECTSSQERKGKNVWQFEALTSSILFMKYTFWFSLKALGLYEFMTVIWLCSNRGLQLRCKNS